MNKSASARTPADQGMATAEYAVGTVAVISLGSLLVKIFVSPEMRALISKVPIWIAEMIARAMGM